MPKLKMSIEMYLFYNLVSVQCTSESSFNRVQETQSSKERKRLDTNRDACDILDGF